MKKRIFTFVSVVIFALGTSLSTFPKMISLKLTRTVLGNSEEEEEGRRKQSKPLTCSIDSTFGVTFAGEEQPIIYSYEIYDVNDFCFGIFYDEMEFVNYLFTLSGEYKIVLTSDDYDFIGWVEL